MKIESKGNLLNKSNTAGLINIKDFEGSTMKISTDLLKKALLVMETMNSAGMDTEYLNIGIAQESDVFVIFFNKEKTFGYGIAGTVEQ